MKQDYIRIRISKELKEEVKKRAEEDNRDMTGYIINLIKNDIKNNMGNK